jgi:hypothetical protein
MRLRFVFLLVAFVLAWSGLGGVDASRADPSFAGTTPAGLQGLASVDDPTGASGPLLPEDRTAQAHADPSSESPALTPEPIASRPARVAERHAGAHRMAAAAPYLDGPLRPPRASAPAA